MVSTNDTQNKQRLSLVDYIIGSANMFHYVTNLEVLNKFPESDHIPIHFSLNANYTENTNNSGDENTQWFPLPKYVWNTNTLESLNITLKDNISKTFHHEYKSSISELKDCDIVAEKFDSFIKQACYRTFKKQKTTLVIVIASHLGLTNSVGKQEITH